jgi:uncharacterized membrane protein
MATMKENRNYIILFLITLAAAFLRFYKLGDFSLSNDELSALNRLQFSNFHDLITKGVMPDFHPALVQVFLYYWTKLFGLSPFVIRLPFILLGIASVPLAYLLGKRWFNQESGLFLAAAIAFFEFPLLFSHIARPYAFGLFFSLLLALLWTKLLFDKKESKALRWKLILSSAFVYALCMYNHYFSFLFALIMGIVGLFFLQKENWKDYLLAAVFAVVLFLPHLSISLTQFSYGGLESWLGKPEPIWIWEHLLYIFNQSLYFLLFTLLLVIIAMILRKKEEKHTNRFRFLAIILWLLPLLIGYFYSRWVNPVLQHSILIFSMPFLLLFLFSFIGKSKKAYLHYILLLLFIIGSLFSSFYVNGYYQKQHFANFMEAGEKFRQWHDEKENISFLLNTNHPYYLDYYLEEDSTEIDYLQSRNDGSEEELKALAKMLDSIDSDYLAFASLKQSPEIMWGMIQSRFPKVEEHFPTQALSSVTLFSKNTEKQDVESVLFYEMDFSAQNKFLQEKQGETVLAIDSFTIWGPGLKIPIAEIQDQGINFVEMHLQAEVFDNAEEILLVFSLDSVEGGNILYKTADFMYFFNKAKSAEVYFSFPFSPDSYYSNTVLNIYLWNKGKRSFIIEKFAVRFLTDRFAY